MRRPLLAFVATIVITGCGQSDLAPTPPAVAQKAQKSAPAEHIAAANDDNKAESKGDKYIPPTAEEMAPMPPEYLAELAKIHEPPEMAGKPMQVRKPVSPAVLKAIEVLRTLRSPEKMTHEQRADAIRELLGVADSNLKAEGLGRALTYAAIATMACIDGAEPETVIGYATRAIDDSDDALALRARMYLRAGDKSKALDDLEKIMMDRNGHSLVLGGDVTPRRDSALCEWSLPDFDAFGNDPRALAAKGLYLSSFIGYGAEKNGVVKESDIRDLYARSAASWHSPIPHVLALTVGGLGSEQSMANMRCLRGNDGAAGVPALAAQCAKADEGTHQQIRELTMALVIDPTFAPALAERANQYLTLAQANHADGKPSRQMFDFAIHDFTAAIAAGVKDQHASYCDRSLALASIGRYQEAALGYEQGMKYAKGGVEDSPFVYQQLAGIYVKLGKFNEAADLLSQAIINTSGGGMDTVIFNGGIHTFRTLYPEYDLVPEEILADAIRRRYEPQFPQSWDRDFISKEGKILSPILSDLYALRGDAYMKAGRRAQALADYGRLKSDAWDAEEPYLPQHVYFTDTGVRNHEFPEPWPPLPPVN